MSRRAPRVAALVLAAGRSARMGGVNKLLAEIGGRPLLARVVDALLATPARPLIVVTGHQARAVSAALGGRDLRFVHNPEYAEGIGASIRTGVRALEAKLDGALVCLGDLPHLCAASVADLLDAFAPDRISVPVHGGRRGHPVLFGRRFFDELARLTGDRGARGVLEAHPQAVREVAVADAGIALDVDDPEDLASARRRASARPIGSSATRLPA